MTDEINIDNTDDYAVATTLPFYLVLNHVVPPHKGTSAYAPSD